MKPFFFTAGCVTLCALILTSTRAAQPSPASPADSALTAARSLMAFEWQFVNIGRHRYKFVFHPDGTTTCDGAPAGTWTVTGPQSFQLHDAPGAPKVEDMNFSADFTSFSSADDYRGHHRNGYRLGLVAGVPALAATPAPPTPAATPTPSTEAPKTYANRIDELIDRRSVLADDIFGPLDREVPATLRDYLADLRENLLDENARHPVTTPQAYSMAAGFCNRLIAAFDERQQMAARLRNNAPTEAAGVATTVRLHPNWIDYLRERDAAAAATHNNTIQTGFAKANILQWSIRAAELRKGLDASYSQFRAAARQPVPAKS